MSFKTRNLYFLRISEQSILPIYVYLDERHLEWMSDQVLQHVLSDLRPRILPKLMSEAGTFTSPSATKKAAVDTYRGDTYQFCYFLRRTEPHSVVIKTRNYVASIGRPAGVGMRVSEPSSNSNPAINSRQTQRKRKTLSTPTTGSPSRSTKKQRGGGIIDLDNSDVSEGQVPDATEADVIDVDQDEDMDSIGDDEDVAYNPQQCAFDFPVDEEEEKPKPALQLKYTGFGIYGHCLCIVVEPWPAIRSTDRTLQGFAGIAQQGSKEKQNITPNISTTATRTKTPLFLADDDAEQGDGSPNQQPNIAMNSWDELETMGDSDNDSEMGGMMAFSQALNLAGDSRPGAVEDDDEMEGAVLFGDADEARQL